MSTLQRTCANVTCKGLFTARSADVARGWGNYCSKKCKARVQEARTGQSRAYQQRAADRDACSVGHIFASGPFGHGQE